MWNRREVLVFASFYAAMGYPAPVKGAAFQADTDLLTLVDASQSMHDARRYKPTLQAIGAALNTPAMAQRLTGGGALTARLEIQLWTDETMRPLTPAYTIDGANVAQVLSQVAHACTAEAHAGTPLLGWKGGTNIATCLQGGVALLATPQRAARRKVVNIVTDDQQLLYSPADFNLLSRAKIIAQNNDITVNVISLGSDAAFTFLASYVQTGPSSFTLNSASFTSLHELFERKFAQDMIF